MTAIIGTQGPLPDLELESLMRQMDRNKLYQVVIYAGQSNTSGGSSDVSLALTGTGVDAPVQGLYMADLVGAKVEAVYPIHLNTEGTSHTTNWPYQHAKRLVAGGAPVIGIFAGHGGSGLVPGTGLWYGPAAYGGDGTGGDAYLLVKDRFNALVAAGYKVWLRGVCWHQGEAEAILGTTKAAYKTAFMSMINGWKAELSADNLGAHTDMLVVIGQLGQDLLNSGFTPTVGVPTSATAFLTIDAAHRELCEENARFAFVDSVGLVFADQGAVGATDNIHFNVASYLRMGERFYSAFRAAETRTNRTQENHRQLPSPFQLYQTEEWALNLGYSPTLGNTTGITGLRRLTKDAAGVTISEVVGKDVLSAWTGNAGDMFQGVRIEDPSDSSTVDLILSLEKAVRAKFGVFARLAGTSSPFGSIVVQHNAVTLLWAELAAGTKYYGLRVNDPAGESSLQGQTVGRLYTYDPDVSGRSDVKTTATGIEFYLGTGAAEGTKLITINELGLLFEVIGDGPRIKSPDGTVWLQTMNDDGTPNWA